MQAKRSEITLEHLFFSRRKFMAGMSTLAAGGLLLEACGPVIPRWADGGEPPPDVLTSYEQVLDYNNYYEYSISKNGIGERAKNLITSPWPVEIGGLVAKPQTVDAAGLLKTYPSEERIYRMRCVEGWSMVIPWQGFPLNQLLADVEPLPEAKYVRFETLYDPQQMPGQRGTVLDWPYVEGLRLDEAMHDLTILAGGIYDKPLPPQVGAPIRLVVPWKYGFKNIKSISKISLVAEEPLTAWAGASPNEYGFYANVNPEVPHPRWSQSSERRIGESGRRVTIMFNDYADEVADLYRGMDLKKYF
ncbi:protein-methionine-sulfoxide reductase catalytic subunit MsrP [Chloroflexota bacterium]